MPIVNAPAPTDSAYVGRLVATTCAPNDVTNPDSASVARRAVRRLTMAVFWLPILGRCLEASIAKSQRGQHEEIQGGRCHEPAENHDRHWPFDLFARLTAAQRQRQQPQRRH